MRGSRRRTDTSGALVGWLFADVALVLMIGFASTSVTASTTTTTTSPPSPPTTLPEVTTTVGVEKGGVELEALEPAAVAIGEPVGTGVVALLEERLADLKSSGVISAVPKRIGVILIYAGARTDGNVTKAKKRSCEVRDALLREWSRIAPGRVYFKCFHDLNLENGFVEFSLFPVLD